MKKSRFITTLLVSLFTSIAVHSQNDPTPDKWIDNGINLVTTTDFTGRVGIGTLTPLRTLTVFSPTAAVVGLMESSHPTGTLLDIRSTTSADAGLRFHGGRTWTIGNDKGLGDSFIIARFNGFPSNTNNSRKDLVIKGNGNIGFGEIDPSDKVEIKRNGGGLDLTHTNNASFSSIEAFENETNQGAIQFVGTAFGAPVRRNSIEIVNRATLGSVDVYTQNNFSLPKLRVQADGNVGIGLNNPAVKLHVNGDSRVNGTLAIGIENTAIPTEYRVGIDGKVICEELKVKNSNAWPDFVFATNYHLMPLEKLEKFIQKNSHLPEIPSAKTVSEEGIELGKMNAKLLQKIEELTLYLIELKHQNEKLTDRVANLENQ